MDKTSSAPNELSTILDKVCRFRSGILNTLFYLVYHSEGKLDTRVKYLLEVFLTGGILTELCLYIWPYSYFLPPFFVKPFYLYISLWFHKKTNPFHRFLCDFIYQCSFEYLHKFVTENNSPILRWVLQHVLDKREQFNHICLYCTVHLALNNF